MQVNKPKPVPLIMPDVFASILDAIVAVAKRDRKQAETALREAERVRSGK